MSKSIRKVELLSPAKDLLCGMEAINHGADAVYIGAPKFGARAAAGNSIEDIRVLCEYAHQFDARVYVALNTILKDEELPEVKKLIEQVYQAGADALIIQDMGITQLDIPPIPLHASTQTDNRTVEKVKFLESAGFSQVVLARELSLPEIKEISSATTVPLEVFVHGALCVSYSGQCYLSACIGGRSANRGECAQYCRLPYRMEDATGKEIVNRKHLLSLKDMNRSDSLEELMDAGVFSFKIEGRLKDVEYVKNITAYYRQKLDTILEKRPEYQRSSTGASTFSFTPVPEKSFNRGFTSYFLQKREKNITSFDTPKSQGEFIGTVDTVKAGYFTLLGKSKGLNNGDGVVYLDVKEQLQGFRINRIENDRIYPLEMPALRKGMKLYRNYDHAFDKVLSKPSAERKIPVRIELGENNFGFTLQITDETGANSMICEPFEKEHARTDQSANIRNQLGKLGDTIFEAVEIKFDLSDNWFIPSSGLTRMKRKAVDAFLRNRKIRYHRELSRINKDKNESYPEKKLTYLANISNQKAEQFYRRHSVPEIAPAFEIKSPENVPLMFSKHCLRYSMGWCPVFQKNQSPYKEPYYLIYKDTRLRLKFDCKKCLMTVHKVL